ncbi:MAG: hypothetical protein J6U92_03820 [Clostridia bacterium]|nr:hypothetical protein [Clostridia bacterium]
MLLIFSFTLGGCWTSCSAVPTGSGRIYTDNNYISEYTPEQHIERISEIFEKYKEKYSEALKIRDYDIYIVYSFDDKPEFFLMEFFWENFINVDKIKTFYSHMVGIIYHDQYYYATSGLTDFGMDLGFGNGKSIYSQLGVLESGKKLLYSVVDVYSEGLFAYVEDGKVMGTEIEEYDYDRWGSVEITYKELREIEPKEFPELVKREPFNARKFCYVR